MKVLSNAIAFWLVILPFAYAPSLLSANAQNSPGCFMLDDNGNPVDLGHLCDGSSNNANTSTIKTRKAQHNTNFFVVPIKKRIHGTPVIEVQFNDKYVFEMLFDTGATMTIITEPMAQTLKIQPTGSLPFQTASNNLIFFKTASVSSASAGNMVSDNLAIAIGPSLDIGLLGQNFYGMYDITIKSDRIEFRKR